MNEISELKNFSKDIKGKIIFDYNIKKTNWFNIGGIAKAYYKPESLNELILFLKRFGSKEKIFLLGAGSNVLISDDLYEGIIIKLGKNFCNITLHGEDIIIAGSAVLDKSLSNFAFESMIAVLSIFYCFL